MNLAPAPEERATGRAAPASGGPRLAHRPCRLDPTGNLLLGARRPDIWIWGSEAPATDPCPALDPNPPRVSPTSTPPSLLAPLVGPGVGP